MKEGDIVRVLSSASEQYKPLVGCYAIIKVVHVPKETFIKRKLITKYGIRKVNHFGTHEVAGKWLPEQLELIVVPESDRQLKNKTFARGLDFTGDLTKIKTMIVDLEVAIALAGGENPKFMERLTSHQSMHNDTIINLVADLPETDLEWAQRQIELEGKRVQFEKLKTELNIEC